MSAGPSTPQVVLLGAGLGVGLVLLEVSGLPSWVQAMTALVSLVPVGLAFALAGWPAAALAAIVAVGGTALVDGATALVVALRHVLPGVTLGFALDRRLSLAMSLVLVSSASLLVIALLLWVFAPEGTSPLTLLQRELEAHLGDLGRLPARLGMGSDPGLAAESARIVAWTMRVAGPGMIIVGLLVGTLANYVVARLVLRGAGFRAFAQEAVPDHLVWWVIAGGLLLVSDQPVLERVGVNLLIALAPLYAIQGFAVVRHFFVRVRVPRPIQVMSFGLFALQPLLLLAVAGLGLSDLWVDFRKIRQAATPA